MDWGRYIDIQTSSNKIKSMHSFLVVISISFSLILALLDRTNHSINFLWCTSYQKCGCLQSILLLITSIVEVFIMSGIFVPFIHIRSIFLSFYFYIPHFLYAWAQIRFSVTFIWWLILADILLTGGCQIMSYWRSIIQEVYFNFSIHV